MACNLPRSCEEDILKEVILTRRVTLACFQDGTVLQTVCGSGSVNDGIWFADHSLVVCFSRSKVSLGRRCNADSPVTMKM